MRLVAEKKVAEPRDAVLVRRLAVALAEYDGVPVQRHYTRSKRLLNSRSGPLSGQARKKPKAEVEIESLIG